MASRSPWSAAIVLGGVLACVPNAGALARPQLTAGVGGTMAIVGTPDPDRGGAAFSLGLLWGFRDAIGTLTGPVRVGVDFRADDLGANRVTLYDPNDGSALGSVTGLHRSMLAAVLRVDADLHPLAGIVPFASGGLGLYAARDDVRGSSAQSSSAAGFNVGGGIRCPLRQHFALGASARYHRVFEDRARRYVTVGLDGLWH